MSLFKSKQNDASNAPPAEGGGEGNGADQGGQTQDLTFVTMEQFQAGLKPLTETLQKIGDRLTEPYQAQPQQSQQPVEDPLKPKHDRIAKIDVELDALADAAEKANYDGKGFGEIVKKQNALNRERTDLVADIRSAATDPRLDVGIQTLDALSSEITAGKMPYITMPEVKASYDKFINQLPAQMRMTPEAKINAYNLAVGANLAAVQEVQKQEWLRSNEEEAAVNTQDAGAGASQSGRSQKSAGGMPAPEDVLSAEALRSIRTTKHKTPDGYYRSLGYDGWEDYYEQNKDYYEEGEEA